MRDASYRVDNEFCRLLQALSCTRLRPCRLPGTRRLAGRQPAQARWRSMSSLVCLSEWAWAGGGSAGWQQGATHRVVRFLHGDSFRVRSANNNKLNRANPCGIAAHQGHQGCASRSATHRCDGACMAGKQRCQCSHQGLPAAAHQPLPATTRHPSRATALRLQRPAPGHAPGRGPAAGPGRRPGPPAKRFAQHQPGHAARRRAQHAQHGQSSGARAAFHSAMNTLSAAIGQQHAAKGAQRRRPHPAGALGGSPIAGTAACIDVLALMARGSDTAASGVRWHTRATVTSALLRIFPVFGVVCRGGFVHLPHRFGAGEDDRSSTQPQGASTR